MKARFSTMLIFLVFSVSADHFDLFIPTDVTVYVDKMDLKGNVAIYTESEFSQENEYIPSNLFSRLISEKRYSLKKDTLMNFMQKGDSQKIRFENGKVTQIENFDNRNTLDDKMTFRYDTNNRLVEKRDYDDDGKLDEIKMYAYDSAGRMVKETVYDEKNKIKDINAITYDTKGNIISEEDFDADNKLERKTLYLEYDEKNNWLKKITISSDDDGSLRIIKRTIIYDETTEAGK